MTGHTPTTQDVRASYRNSNSTLGGIPYRGPYESPADLHAEFDRWLAAHDAELTRQSPASTTAADAPDDVETIRDDVMIALTKAGYDLSGTDHSQPNEIEVGGDDVEFRLTITAL